MVDAPITTGPGGWAIEWWKQDPLPPPIQSLPQAKARVRQSPLLKRLQERRQQLGFWTHVRAAESLYRRNLRFVSMQVQGIIEHMSDDEASVKEAAEMLVRYADLIAPWAGSVARRMLVDVNKRDLYAWSRAGEKVKRPLALMAASAPVIGLHQQLQGEQIRLIQSVSLLAARRLNHLLITRPYDYSVQLEATGTIAQARGDMIARTGTARAATATMQARAQHLGCQGYIWRTKKDGQVRPRHRLLEGKFIAWGDPPISGEHGERCHAGEIHNCRCVPDPVLPEY